MSFKEVDEKESEEEIEEEPEKETKTEKKTEVKAPPKIVAKEYMPKVTEGSILFEEPRGKVTVDFKEEDLELIATKDISPAWKKVGEANKNRVLVINSEKADAVFKADGTVEKTEATGLIGFYNPNAKDRVWDIDSYWENLAKTNLTTREGLCHIDVYELEPSELRAKKYTIKDVEPLLKLEESVNTAPGKEKGPNVMIKDKETVAEIKVTAINTSGTKLENIAVEKDVKALGEISDIKANVGTAKKEGNKVIWSGFSLDPKGSKSMTFKVPLSAKTVDPFKTGDTSATYVAPDMTLSGIAFMGSDGYTKNVAWLDKDEIDKSPGRWNCAIEFENLSTFEVLLREVEVYKETAEHHIFKKRSDKRQQLIVDEERLDVTLSPDTKSTWSKAFVFPDPKEPPVLELPNFGQKVTFSVKNMFLREAIGSVLQYAGEITVADMQLEKKFAVNEISAAETKPIMTTLAASNTGSARFNDLIFKETIPPGFDVVDRDKIDVNLIRTVEETKEVKKLQILRAAKADLPTDDVKKERQLIVSLSDVSKQANIGAILPGDRVEVEYPLQPVSPEPGKEHTPPFTVLTNVLPPFTDAAEFKVTEAKEKLIVKPYIWRKVRVGKSIKEGAAKGEYAITVSYKNKLKPGEIALVTDKEVSLPDITVNDILPEGFKLVSSSPKVTAQRPKLIEGKSFTVLEWSIKDIGPEQTVEINYTIKGETGAAYKARDAQALLTA